MVVVVVVVEVVVVVGGFQRRCCGVLHWVAANRDRDVADTPGLRWCTECGRRSDASAPLLSIVIKTLTAAARTTSCPVRPPGRRVRRGDVPRASKPPDPS